MIQESEPSYVSLRIFTSLEIDAERMKNLANIFDKFLSNPTTMFSIVTDKKNITGDLNDLEMLPFDRYNEINDFIIESKGEEAGLVKIKISYKYFEKNIHIDIRHEKSVTFSEELKSFFSHNKIWYEIVYSNPLKFMAVIVGSTGTFLPDILMRIFSYYGQIIPIKSLNVPAWILAVGVGYFSSLVFRKFFPLYRINFGLEKIRLKNLTNLRNFVIGIPSAVLTLIGIVDLFKNH